MGEFASVAAELVQAGVELANRELEVARLRQALTNRIWIEQANYSWEGVGLVNVAHP